MTSFMYSSAWKQFCLDRTTKSITKINYIVRCADGRPISDQLLETSAGKILQLENENKRLLKQLASLRGAEHDSNASKTTKTKLRHIANGISNTADTNGVNVDDLEAENTRLALNVRQLQARLVALQTAGDSYSELETRASLLDLENKRLARKVESFQQTVIKVESLEQENGRLIAELEQATKKAKEWSEAVGKLELEKERLERSVQQLEKAVDEARMEGLRARQLEEELSAMETERDRLQRQLMELSGPADDVPLRDDEAPEKMTSEDVNHRRANTRSASNRYIRCLVGWLRVYATKPGFHYPS